MITPRILFTDVAAAAPWVGLAKQLGRQTYDAGIISKTFVVADGVKITVNNVITKGLGGICKVWIEAGNNSIWYQFITTGPEISLGADGVYKGSAVAVKLPYPTLTKPVDLSKIKPVATGSTLEELPTDPPTPVLEKTNLTQRVNGAVQVQLHTEPLFYGYSDLTEYSKYIPLVHSWMGQTGVIKGFGKYALISNGEITDVGYDAAPTTIDGKHLNHHEPDMDWPHEAAIVRKTSVEFGDRTFIVAVDASNKFYCWVNSYDSYEALASPYAVQLQSINIPDSDVISVEAPFPEWVHVTPGDRRDTDYGNPNVDSVKNVWRFHPQGTKVVGVVLERKVFSGDVYAQASDLQPNKVGFFVQENIGPAKLKSYPDPVDIKNDWPGYVEFSIDITITGPNKNDYTFGLTKTREQQSDETHYPIGAAYLSPVLGGWDKYGIDGSPGDLVVLDLASYWGERDKVWVDRYCGFAHHPNEYIRQTWANIIDIDKANLSIMSVLIKDQPSEFFRKKFGLDKQDCFTINSTLKSIDLSKLTFVYKAHRERFFYGDSYYQDFSYGLYDNKYYSHKSEQQVGIRFYVFGKVVKETQQGTDLGVWTAVDNCNLFEGADRFSPIETHTRWLSSIYDYGPYRDHWCLGDFAVENTISDHNLGPVEFRYLIFDGSGFHNNGRTLVEEANPPTGATISGYRYITSSEIQNAALYSLSRLSSSTTGDLYTRIERVLTGPAVSDGTYYSPGNGITFSVISVPYIRGYVDHYTNILQELSDNCESFDKTTYLPDVLVPWIQEQWSLSDIPVIQHQSGFHEAWVFFNPEPYFEDEQSSPYVLSYVITPTTYSDEDLWIFSSKNTRFSSPVVFDSRLATYDINKKHHRIYDYEIGAEVMGKQWRDCIEQGPPIIISSPEGYYSGVALNVPYHTGSFVEGILNTTQVTPAISYGFTYAYNNAYHDYPAKVNKPDVAQLAFFTVDSVGHVSGASTSNVALYTEAYEKALTFPTPDCSIGEDTLYGTKTTYQYRKSYDGLINYPFYDTIYEIIYTPVLNGSMLFSK